jgi:Zn finger protein HypA/HybF involved in hydrogenase expression
MSDFELIYCDKCKAYYEMSFKIGLACPHCKKNKLSIKKIDDACKKVKQYIDKLGECDDVPSREKKQ